jgi:hypothetical protein
VTPEEFAREVARTGVVGLLLVTVDEAWRTGELPDRELVLGMLEILTGDEGLRVQSRNLAAVCRGALIAAERDGTPVLDTLDELGPLIVGRGATRTNQVGDET